MRYWQASIPVLALALGACGGTGEAPAKQEAAAATPAPAPKQIAFSPTGDPQTGGKPGVCDFGGWSEDKDSAGLNVHAGPSGDSPVVGRLPPPIRDDGREWKTEFDVVESRNGWFRIVDVADFHEPHDARSAVRRLKVTGWIHGSMVGFALQTDAAFAEPDPRSPVVVTAWRDRDGGGRSFGYRRPMACKGHWVKLLVTGHDGKEREAWARGICEIQETTCDGGAHDTRGDLIAYDTVPVH